MIPHAKSKLFIFSGSKENDMTQQEIMIRQGPLIEKYRYRPENATVVFSAQGVLGENGTFRIQTGDLFKEAGLHPASGGSGIHLWPGDMFLESLAASVGVTLNSIAASLGMNLESALIVAEGEIDFRGNLAVADDAPVGFKTLKLKFEIVSDAAESEISNLIRLTEKYCVIYQTLKKSPEIEVTLSLNA
jgi:uncharacterized OsmC-like protein